MGYSLRSHDWRYTVWYPILGNPKDGVVNWTARLAYWHHYYHHHHHYDTRCHHRHHHHHHHHHHDPHARADRPE